MIDVGVFTGASSLAAALAVPKGGKVIACDVNEEYTKEAQKRWAEADVEDIVDLRIAPAAETLQSLIDAGEAGSYDFAFIDADKLGYDSYYELCLQLLRPGGEDFIHLLHFVAFFHVASLLSTGADNEKVGVVNKKALELTNSSVFHRARGRQ